MFIVYKYKNNEYTVGILQFTVVVLHKLICKK